MKTLTILYILLICLGGIGMVLSVLVPIQVMDLRSCDYREITQAILIIAIVVNFSISLFPVTIGTVGVMSKISTEAVSVLSTVFILLAIANIVAYSLFFIWGMQAYHQYTIYMVPLLNFMEIILCLILHCIGKL